MDNTIPSLKFQLDIKDYQDDNEIVETIKKLLKLTKDKEFIKSVKWNKGEKVSVEVSPKISFVISGCV